MEVVLNRSEVTGKEHTPPLALSLFCFLIEINTNNKILIVSL